MAKKKKQALDNLLDKGRISKSTHDSFNSEIAVAMAEIEKQQCALTDKMQHKTAELDSQIKTLEMLLANYEIQYAAGEIDENTYNLEINLLSNGLTAAKHEMDMIKDAVTQLCTPVTSVSAPEPAPLPVVEVAPAPVEIIQAPVTFAPAGVIAASEPCVMEAVAAPAPEPVAAPVVETTPVVVEEPVIEAPVAEATPTIIEPPTPAAIEQPAPVVEAPAVETAPEPAPVIETPVEEAPIIEPIIEQPVEQPVAEIAAPEISVPEVAAPESAAPEVEAIPEATIPEPVADVAAEPAPIEQPIIETTEAIVPEIIVEEPTPVVEVAAEPANDESQVEAAPVETTPVVEEIPTQNPTIAPTVAQPETVAEIAATEVCVEMPQVSTTTCAKEHLQTIETLQDSGENKEE